MPDDLIASIPEDLLRLVVAALAGMLVGLNREVRGKALGMRTLGLVSMGSALIAIAATEFADLAEHPDALSRLVQGVTVGVMTGIGFLGAGAIIRDRTEGQVHGLTTAATTWVAAGIGVASGFAAWHLVAAGAAVTLLILMMRPVERALVRLFGRDPDANEPGEEQVAARGVGRANPALPAAAESLEGRRRAPKSLSDAR